MLLPAIQAARESAPAAEGDECLVFLVGGVPKESEQLNMAVDTYDGASDLGEFVYGTELPAVQDGTSNTVFYAEGLLLL
jgi:hypothetical protein